MGTGYGVYVFKAKTGQHVLTDTDLRPAWSFRYRVGAVLRAGESPATSASATTLARAADAGTADTSAPPIRRCATPDGTPALSPLPPDIVVLGLLSATDYMHDLDGHMITLG